MLHGLYAITDPMLLLDKQLLGTQLLDKQLPGEPSPGGLSPGETLTGEPASRARLLRGVEAALRGGVRLLQYRDKPASADERLQRARALRQLCDRYETKLLINDDVALARACGADGVHLGQQDGIAARVREQWPDAVIGVTCHDSLALALRAQQDGASYVAFGRLFPSHTKPQAPACPLSRLQEARAHIHVPICAIGGIDVSTLPQLQSCAPDLYAVIHGLFAADDIEATAQTLLQQIATIRAHHQQSATSGG